MTYEPAFVFTGTEDESPTFNVTEPMVWSFCKPKDVNSSPLNTNVSPYALELLLAVIIKSAFSIVNVPLTKAIS